MNNRHDHPRARFERHVEKAWGKSVSKLSSEDRDLAIADWGYTELAQRINHNRVPGWRSAALPLLERTGPWGLLVGLVIYVVQAGG